MDISSILFIITLAYFLVGFIYALYILLFAGDGWLAFPVNMLFGPIYLLLVAKAALSPKIKHSYKDIFYGKKAVIFDLDGTLVDTATIWEDAFAEVKAELEIGYVPNDFSVGLNVRDDWKVLLRSRDLPKDFKTDQTPEQLAQKTEAEFLKFFDLTDPKDGFWSFVADLKENGFKLALASNTTRSVVDEVIKKLGMANVFDVIVGGDEVKRRKPAPEIYLKTAKLLGLRAKDCVVFEDSIVGAEAACRAGMNTVVIWDGNYDQDVYHKKVMMFLEDFTSLPGNIYKTNKEMLEEAAKLIEEERKLISNTPVTE